MQYRSFMIAIAVLIICACSVSALTISTVTTEDGKKTTTMDGSTSTQTTSTGTQLEDIQEDEETALSLDTEEDIETDTEESTEENIDTVDAEGEVPSNCVSTSGNELIIRFEPEIFEDIDGTLNELAMEQAEIDAHTLIQATVLSDLTEMGMPGLQLVKLPDDMSLEEGIAYYESLEEVRFAEPNYHISIYPDGCSEETLTEADDMLIETVDEQEDALTEGEDEPTEKEDVHIESGDGFTRTVVNSERAQVQTTTYTT